MNVENKMLTETCEGCDRIINEGDIYFPCEDGPVLCADCCPTWADAEAQFNRDAELGEDEYMKKDRLDFAERMKAHLAAGGDRNDKLPMSPL